MTKLRTNSYLIFDFETGGLVKNPDPAKGDLNPLRYPITDFACIALKGDDLSEILRYDALIAPYDDSLIYDPIAAEITGITRELAEAEGIALADFSKDLIQIFTEMNDYASRYQKAVLVGHNIRFDIPFLQEVAKRTGLDLSKYLDGDYNNEGQFSPRYLDTEKLGLMMWGGNTAIREFKLGTSCERAGIDIVGAHRAMPDVMANTELFRYFVNAMRGVKTEGASSAVSEEKRQRFHF